MKPDSITVTDEEASALRRDVEQERQALDATEVCDPWES